MQSNERSAGAGPEGLDVRANLAWVRQCVTRKGVLPADAADLAQDVWAVLLTKYREGPVDKPRHLLAAIATRRVWQYFGKRQSNREFGGLEAEPTAVMDHARMLEDRDAFEWAASALDELEFTIFVQRVVYERSVEEVVALLAEDGTQISARGVVRKYRKAREDLEKRLRRVGCFSLVVVLASLNESAGYASPAPLVLPSAGGLAGAAGASGLAGGVAALSVAAFVVNSGPAERTMPGPQTPSLEAVEPAAGLGPSSRAEVIPVREAIAPPAVATVDIPDGPRARVRVARAPAPPPAAPAPAPARAKAPGVDVLGREAKTPAPREGSGRRAAELRLHLEALAAVREDPERALALLDRLADRFPRTQWDKARASARVEALLRACRGREAEVARARFAREYEDEVLRRKHSTIARRVRCAAEGDEAP